MPDSASLQDDLTTATGRLRTAALMVLATLVGGTSGYYVLGAGDWSLLDCAYMTAITLTTVGYNEVLPIQDNPAARLFTILLIFLGMGVVLYFASTLTAFILDGDLRNVVRVRRMRKLIAGLNGHFIVCGSGQTGEHVLGELVHSGVDVVVIDVNRGNFDRCQRDFKHILPHIIGDATDDDVLLAAGLERAAGVVVSLGNEHDNLLCTITTRTLNPNVRIIARGEDQKSEQKFRRAGADRVVYTSAIGGLRMAAELLRPQVVTFLDVMLRDQERRLRIEEIPLSATNTLAGKSLMQTNLRSEFDLLVIAVHDRATDKFIYNPSSDLVLEEHHTLIVLGEVDHIASVRLQTS
jgi:voltage-gated potassium channel